MKRVLIFAFIFIILISGISAQESEKEHEYGGSFSEDLGHLWDTMKERTANVYHNATALTNPLEHKLNQIIRLEAFEGEENILGGGEFNLNKLIRFSSEFGLALAMIIFLMAIKLYGKKASWSLLIISIIIGIGFASLYYLLFMNILHFPILENTLKISLPIFIWTIIFFLIHLFIDYPSQNSSIKDINLYLPLIFALIYPFLAIIPIINRILYIITLEVLQLHWLWRSLILAAVLFYGPIFWERYSKYRKRKLLYDQKLEEIAAIEGAKAMLQK